MFRSYGILISLMGLALVVGMGCSDDPGPTGGTGGNGGNGGGAGGAGGMAVCPPGAAVPEPVVGTVPMACRNSFNQLASVFPVTLDVALDCSVADQPFNANITPTLALDTAHF